MNIENWKVEDLFRASYEEAMNSPDPSTQNGAILLNEDYGIIGRGYNDFPYGVDQKYWNGSKDDKYARVCHAEVSCILDASRLGNSTYNSIMICGWAACSNCAKYLSYAGVKKLIRHPYGDNTTGNNWLDDCRIGDEIMQAGKVNIIEVPVVSWDGVLRRNSELWSPNGVSVG